MTKTFFCVLCDETIEHEVSSDDVYEGIAAAMDHFRVLHPDMGEFETWPDGSPVVVDKSLEPDDFSGTDRQASEGPTE